MTKEIVLSMLKAADGFLSGEQISKELGVSRMTISTAVKALREEGYEIESVTKKGYRILSSGEKDRLTVGELMVFLPRERCESVLLMDSVDSTNRKMKELALQGAGNGMVVIANEQTAGRGKRKGSFSSQRNEGIYLSYLIKKDNMSADQLPGLSRKAGESVAETIREICHAEAEISGINDVLVNQRKVCGILTEVSLEGESGLVEYAILGIGVRVHQSDTELPKVGEGEAEAGSLFTCLGIHYSRAELTAALIRKLDRI